MNSFMTDHFYFPIGRLHIRLAVPEFIYFKSLKSYVKNAYFFS